MALQLTKENILLLFPSWLKPLSNQEIKDFLDTPIEEEKRLWYPDWPKDLPRQLYKTTATKKYNTKKELKQDIKIIDDRLNWWMIYKRTAPNEMTKVYCDLHIEELDIEKGKLKKKMIYTGVKFDNNNLVKARQVPISDFIKFNNMGMAKCLWHTERTPSLHMIKGKNKVYCFGGCGIKDVIEVVQQINNCTFKEALKIILQ